MTCTDKNCSEHGTIALRGRTFTGTVISVKMVKTATIEWSRKKYLPKFERYERRRTCVKAHNPECINAAVGDHVIITECRPLSKTKKFIITKKLSTTPP